MRGRLKADLLDLMMIPGLSGHEDRVRHAIGARLTKIGVASRSDRLGNLIATFPGDADAPSVMLFTHMDQIGFIVRGAVVAAQTLRPDIAIQIDLMLASDTPEMADHGDMRLGGGPGISLYSFHGRGTLKGVIPHPAMVQLFEAAAQTAAIPLQRSAQVGVLTDLSYVQLVDAGVASIDIGFPMRHSHSLTEMCDLADLEALGTLILTALPQITADFPLNRD